ncbi:MAG: ATP-binding protein [Bacteroidia bacterium]
MIKYLEEILQEKTKGTQSEILLAQWSYDKKVIPSALQAVSNLFPHYSLHDESHSITIVNNIVRILGKENISKLSAIDIWLILEVSYCHDIGMVVTSDKILESLTTPKFLEYFKELLSDTKNGLHEFATKFKIVENKIEFNNTQFEMGLIDGMKFILAEYFRRIHAERSKEIIINPIHELSLLSPRGVIAPRIFKILGDICSSHTKDFDSVMDLPFSEVGIDIEDAHPRFIACLLRIGDLLDLDNNRFSEVMLRTLTKVPIDTLNHKSKHLSIESFRVDRERIEIAAKCKDYDTANVTQHWFNYLNSEISSQMIRWNEIVPNKELGYLPTIGNLKVELTNYDFIDGKNKPKFTIDTDKALSLLQGAGLYDGAYQCIREILQNSVDATLVRIWLEYRDEKDFSTPQSQDFLDILKNYPITIKIHEKELDRDYKNWEIEITDRGTGISSLDLKFLMNTGSSSKNKEKIRIIEGMPTWMRPSGTFGIGFQSIFMLTDVVKIETKSFSNEQFQIIELNGPNSKKDGDILIQKKITDHSIKPGSKIIINHQTKAIPDGWSIKGEQKNANLILNNFDPFSVESLDIELGKILDEILDFNYRSQIPIELFIDNKSIVLSTTEGTKFKYFDFENAMELNIYTENSRWNGASTFYKNQGVENGIGLKFINLEINIHKQNESEVLTLNRNKVREDFRYELKKQTIASAFKIIIKNFGDIFISDEEKAFGSMFLNYYSDWEGVKELDITNFNHWRLLEIEIATGEKVKLDDILSTISKLKMIYPKGRIAGEKNLFTLADKELTIELKAGDNSNITDFIFFISKKIFTSIFYDDLDGIKEIVFTKEKQSSPISENKLKNVILQLKSGFSHSSRVIIPCIEEFFNLRIKDKASKHYVYHYTINENISGSIPVMLSPFVRKSNYSEHHWHGVGTLEMSLNEKVYDWVFDNRYDSKTTMEEIKATYKLFCEKYKRDV